MKWTTQKRKISDLIPFEQNPRQMTDKQARDLRNSLEKFDLVEIPAINSDNTILAGHQRLKILSLLGRRDEEIDVRVPDRLLTDAEVREYNVRSNKNTAEWDWDMLANFDELMLKEIGFSDKELEKAFGLNLEPPEVEFTEELSEEHNYVVLYFENEIDWLQLQTLFPLGTVKGLDAKPGYERKGVGRVVRGIDFINKIRK